MENGTEYPYLVRNNAGGMDLMVERDSGNPVLILTGKPLYSRAFWKKIGKLVENALFEMEEL